MSGVDKVSGGISSDKYQLFNFLKQKYDYSNTSIFFDTMGYGDDFDWSTYADLLNGTIQMPEISKTDTDEVAKQKSFMQIIKEIFSQESVIAEADTIVKDGKLSADEIKNYISNNNVMGLDGDASNISLNDLENLLNNKSINLSQTVAALDEAAGGGDTGGTIPPSSPTSETVTGYQDTAFDTTTYDGSTQMLDAASAGVIGLTNMTSADIATDKSMESFSHVSAAKRNELQKCAQDKEAAAVARDEAAAKVTDQASKELVDKYAAAVEAQQLAQEKITDISGKLEYCQNESTNLEASINSLDGSIRDLESQINNSGGSEETEEARAQREATNNAIRQRIVALEQELSNQKASKRQIDTQIGTLTTALGTAKSDLETATTSVTESQAKLSTLTDENAIAYANAVTDYNTAASAYNSKKAEVVKEENDAILKEQENNRKLAEEQRKSDTAEMIDIATSPDALKDAKDYQTLTKLMSGEMNVENLDPEKDKALIAAYEQIDQLSDEEIAQIEKTFGGGDILELALIFKDTDYMKSIAACKSSEYEKLLTLDPASAEYQELAGQLDENAVNIVLSYKQSVTDVGEADAFENFAGKELLTSVYKLEFDADGNLIPPTTITDDQFVLIQKRYFAMLMLHDYSFTANEDASKTNYEKDRETAKTENFDETTQIMTSTGLPISLNALAAEPVQETQAPAAETDTTGGTEPTAGNEQATDTSPSGYGSEADETYNDLPEDEDLDG